MDKKVAPRNYFEFNGKYRCNLLVLELKVLNKVYMWGVGYFLPIRKIESLPKGYPTSFNVYFCQNLAEIFGVCSMRMSVNFPLASLAP